MAYDSVEEMEEVVGKLEDNVFILEQEEELAAFRTQIEKVLTNFQLKLKSPA